MQAQRTIRNVHTPGYTAPEVLNGSYLGPDGFKKADAYAIARIYADMFLVDQAQNSTRTLEQVCEENARKVDPKTSVYQYGPTENQQNE